MNNEDTRLELYKIKKTLINDIKNLSKNEHIQIFHIIKNANIKYTENNNGIFINLNNINDNILYKLIDFIKYTKFNNNELEKIDKIQDKLREENIK
tara:strand:+ start:171 stop:458 length:288 start_codon:yes stop_codon:yes gene_type:complete